MNEQLIGLKKEQERRHRRTTVLVAAGAYKCARCPLIDDSETIERIAQAAGQTDIIHGGRMKVAMTHPIRVPELVGHLKELETHREEH